MTALKFTHRQVNYSIRQFAKIFPPLSYPNFPPGFPQRLVMTARSRNVFEMFLCRANCVV